VALVHHHSVQVVSVTEGSASQHNVVRAEGNAVGESSQVEVSLELVDSVVRLLASNYSVDAVQLRVFIEVLIEVLLSLLLLQIRLTVQILRLDETEALGV